MEKINSTGSSTVRRQGEASTSGRVEFTRLPSCTPKRRQPLRGNAAIRSESRGEVTLLDYGAGNVRSVRNAIKKLGYNLKEVTPLHWVDASHVANSLQSDVAVANCTFQQ